MTRERPNALVDDPDWCGHWRVSLRTWTCADCDRAVNSETRARLEASPTKAPAGAVWMLMAGDQDEVREACIRGDVEGLFTDRSRIGWLMVRRLIVGADRIRDVLRRTHWYQGVFNDQLFEGWEEEPDEHGICHAYYLSLEWIDKP